MAAAVVVGSDGAHGDLRAQRDGVAGGQLDGSARMPRRRSAGAVPAGATITRVPRAQRAQRGAVGVVAMQVRQQHDVHVGGHRGRGDVAAQVRHARPEDRVGQEAEAGEVEEDGRVAEPGEAVGADGGLLRVEGGVAERRQPAAQHAVQVRGADDLLLGHGQRGGGQDEGERLWSAEPAVGADQLLEGRDLLGLRPVGAVDHDVGAVGEAGGAGDVRGGARAERRQRVGAGDGAVVELVLAAGAEHEVAAVVVAHEDEADARVREQRRQQRRVVGVDRRAADAAGQAGEGDEAEAARGHDDDLGELLGRRRAVVSSISARRPESVRTARAGALSPVAASASAALSWPPASSLSPALAMPIALGSASQASRTSASSVMP